jgi:5-methylcytosine-specific restriction endonuclease McrA
LIVGTFPSAEEAHAFAGKMQAAQDRGVLGGYRDDTRLFIPATEQPDEVARLKRIPYSEYLQSAHWQRIRKEALRRAVDRCQVCNNSSKLNVHHRTYAHRGEEREGDVVVLCHACHELFHKHGVLTRS